MIRMNETQRFFNWMKRHDLPVNILRDYENGFWYNTNRKAITSWGRAERYEYPSSKLMNCDVCGRIGGKKQIQSRWDVDIGWLPSCKQDYEDIYGCVPEQYISEWRTIKILRGRSVEIPWFTMKTDMCWSCYNKLKPISKKIKLLKETGGFLRKNKKEISYEKLNQNN